METKDETTMMMMITMTITMTIMMNDDKNNDNNDDNILPNIRCWKLKMIKIKSTTKPGCYSYTGSLVYLMKSSPGRPW